MPNSHSSFHACSRFLDASLSASSTQFGQSLSPDPNNAHELSEQYREVECHGYPLILDLWLFMQANIVYIFFNDWNMFFKAI